MLDDPPALTIHRGHRRPDPALVARFRGAETSHLVDAMGGRGALAWNIKPLEAKGCAFVGTALTAFAGPADIVAVHGALAEAQAGDVVVIANDGYLGTAVVGDLICGMFRNKGVVALVTEGLARDRAGIVATGLPVFCAGLVPTSPAGTGPGVVGAPIVCGGIAVASGDIVVGDADGVVIVPQAMAAAVLDSLDGVRAAEAKAVAAVAGGATESAKTRALVAAARIVTVGG